jgi:hypothetical protein
VQLTPLSTHWAKIKKGTIFFGHPVFISRNTVRRQIAADTESVIKQRKNKYFDIHPNEFGTVIKIEIITAGLLLEFETGTFPL